MPAFKAFPSPLKSMGDGWGLRAVYLIAGLKLYYLNLTDMSSVLRDYQKGTAYDGGRSAEEKIVSRAFRNVRRGNADEESDRGMYREEIRLDLQQSRFFTESFRETDGQAMVLRRAKALASLLTKMGIFIRDHERIVGYQTSDINGICHPIDQNWKSPKRLVHSEAGKKELP